MKKILILFLLVTLSFSKWVMTEGQHITDNRKVMYIYNDQTGEIYINENIYDMKRKPPIPTMSGFQRVFYIVPLYKNGKFKKFIYKDLP